MWAIVDGDEAVELYVQREDAERFLEDVRCDDQELAETLRLEPSSSTPEEKGAGEGGRRNPPPTLQKYLPLLLPLQPPRRRVRGRQA